MKGSDGGDDPRKRLGMLKNMVQSSGCASTHMAS